MVIANIHDRARDEIGKHDYLNDLLKQREDGVLYPLQPKQKVFMNVFAKYRLFGGAKGGGKSYAMRAEAVRQALSAPNVKGLILRRTFPEVRKNTLHPMLLELKMGGVKHKYNGGTKTITFPNGSTIEFSYCRNYQDVMRYQGIEYDFICVEELTHWREEEFKILKSCLRSPRPGIVPNFFASTNPGGIGHAWVRRIWINRDFSKAEKPQDYAFTPANVYDNYVLMDSQPEYMEDLEDLPDTQREAFLHGNWDVFEGQYFPEFDRNIHVMAPFYPVIGIKRRIIAFDYGYSAPSAVYWMAVDNQGKITVYRELYITKQTYKMLGTRIAAMTPQGELKEIKIAVGDPAAINKKSEKDGGTLKDDFKKALPGVKVIAGKNSRLDGWMRIRQHLALNYNPSTEEQEPLLAITESCPNLIRTLPELIYDTTNVEDCDTTQEDHGPDGLRYGIMELSVGKIGFLQVKSMNVKLNKGNDIKKEGKYKSEFFKKSRPDRKENLLNKRF